MARPTIQISTQAWFVKRQLDTRYDSTSHSTTMPSLCHHYATMPLCHYAISTRPLDLNGFNAFTFALPRTSHARHRSALLIFGTMMALRRLGWLEQFCATSSRKKLHNVAFHVNKVQHGPAKKKTKASEARFHIQPCGEQASQWIHICHVGRRLDHQLLACPYLVEQQTLVWPKQPLAVAGWQWAKWTSSWFVQVTCDLTNRGGTIPL